MTRRLVVVAALLLSCGALMAADKLVVITPSQPNGRNQADPVYAGFKSSCTLAVAGLHEITGSSVAAVVSQLLVSTGAAGGTVEFYDNASYRKTGLASTAFEIHATSPTLVSFSPSLRFKNGVVLWNSNAVRSCVLYMKQ